MKKFSKCTKKVLSFLLTTLMVLAIFTVSPIMAEAVSNTYPDRQNVDGDGYYEIPCTRFAWQQVYDNLGIALPNWGHAVNWWNSAINSGYATGSTPKAGAIAVWSGGSNGHVAYVVSGSGNTFIVNEGGRTDLDHTSSHGVAYGYQITNSVGSPRPYDSEKILLGFIYPSGTIANVDNAWINVNASTFLTGSTVQFNLGADNATGYTIGIDRDGVRIITENVGTNPTYTFTEPGNYSAYVTAWNHVSGQDSNRVSFRVIKPLNFGESFYAVILNKGYWKPIGSTDDNNIVLQTETGVASQLWKFERQNDSTYEIKNAENGLNIDVDNYGIADYTNVKLCGDNNGSAQRWYIVANGNGYSFIPNCAINSAMSLHDNSDEDGANIEIYTYNQDWSSQIFAIYAENDVQLNSNQLSVITGTSEEKTAFSWSGNYGEKEYHLNIWNGTALNGDTYYTDNSINANMHNIELLLPAGYYEARVDAVNYFESKSSNIVSFTVSPKTIVNINNNEVDVEWSEVLKAKSYMVNVYNTDTDELVLTYENIENNNCLFNIENGEYYLVVSSDNNISSKKISFSIDYLKGDINNDGTVSKADIYAWTAIYANQSITPPTEYQLAVGDLNKNGKYDTADKMYLNRLIA